MALEASALERETRGFISITTISSVCGLTANWMFEPPVSTPTARMTAQRLVAQRLVLAVGQRLLRSHRDRVAGVHAHRVDVLDRADDHHVVVVVAHDLELELAPADHRLLHQHLVDRRGGQALGHPLAVLLLGEGGAAALAAHGEAGPDDGRQADVAQRALGLA